jgi:hypothetical protein
VKLSNIPHVRADAIDAALTNFFAANDLKPIALGKRRLQNLVRWIERSNRAIAERNDVRRQNGLGTLLSPTTPEDQTLHLEWNARDGITWVRAHMWTSLAKISSERLSPLSRAGASQASQFKIRIYNNAGGYAYFLFTP